MGDVPMEMTEGYVRTGLIDELTAEVTSQAAMEDQLSARSQRRRQRRNRARRRGVSWAYHLQNREVPEGRPSATRRSQGASWRRRRWCQSGLPRHRHRATGVAIPAEGKGDESCSGQAKGDECTAGAVADAGANHHASSSGWEDQWVVAQEPEVEETAHERRCRLIRQQIEQLTNTLEELEETSGP